MTELAAATATTISSSIDGTTLVCIVQVGHCAMSNVVVGVQLVGAPGQVRGCQDRSGGLSPILPPSPAAAGQGPELGSKLLDFPAIFFTPTNTQDRPNYRLYSTLYKSK